MKEPQIRITAEAARGAKGGLRLAIILASVLCLAVLIGALLYGFVY
jgi:hypothetical protein